MTLPGALQPPRSCFDHDMRSLTTTPEMEALRRWVWREQSVASLAVEDIADPWLRQAVLNEAARRRRPRNAGLGHGR